MVINKKILVLVVTIFSICATFIFPHSATAVGSVYFRLVASEGQGAGSNQFYQGRCFRVNIYLNTGANNTNGADVEINYNVSALKVVQNDCSTQADGIYDDGLFNVYPSQGNSVSSNKIKLSAYNNPGNSTNVSNGLYGHFFVKVLDAIGDYTMAFEYTQGSTVDTNLVRTNGDGSDILDSVGDLSLNLAIDTDDPEVLSLSPADSATGVAINSNVSFNLYDASAGINSAVTTVRMREGSGSWHTQTASIGSQQSTNQNRYYQYTGTVSPNSSIKISSGYYKYNTTYSVEVNETDLANPTTHDYTKVWSFTTEDDLTAPYVDSRVPADSATGVSTSTNIFFRIKDYKNNGGSILGLGVNTGSITMVVASASSGNHSYNCQSSGVSCNTSDPNNISVTINPDFNFLENEAVTVTVNGSDLHSPANAMVADVYSFNTADTQPPVLSVISPAANSFGNASSTNISFHISDSGYGVALGALSVNIDGIDYVAGSPLMAVSGDSSDYGVSINSAANFLDNSAVVVKISARDQAPSPNYLTINPYQYTFIVGLSTSTPAEACPICTVCPTYSCGGGGGGTVYIKEPQTCPKCEAISNTIVKEVCLGKETGNNSNLTNNIFKDVPSSSKVESVKKTSIVTKSTEPSVLGNGFIVSNIVQNNAPKIIKVSNVDNQNFNFDKWVLVVISLISLLSFFFPNKHAGRMGYVVVITLVIISLFGSYLTQIKFDYKFFSGSHGENLANTVLKEAGVVIANVDLKGRLVDLKKQPLSGVVVSLEDKRTITSKDGIFELKDAPPNERVKIYGDKFLEPIYLDIRQAPKTDLSIDYELAHFVNLVEKDYKQNRFKNLYLLLNDASIKAISADKFVNLYNQRLLTISGRYNVVDSWFDYNFKISENWYSDLTKINNKNIISVNFVRRISDPGGEIKYLEEIWHVTKTAQGYRLVI